MNRASSSRIVAAVALAWGTVATACTENNYFDQGESSASDDAPTSGKKGTSSPSPTRKAADSGADPLHDASVVKDAANDASPGDASALNVDGSVRAVSVPCDQDGAGTSKSCESSSATPICCSAWSGGTHATKCVADVDECAMVAAPLKKPLIGIFYVECTKNTDCEFPEMCRLETKGTVTVVACTSDTGTTLQACTSPLECTGGCQYLNDVGVLIGYCN